MKIRNTLATIAALSAAVSALTAADITGTVTLKGTPPAEKDITPLKDDPTCGKLHTEMPKTRFYVVGPNAQLADVVVYLDAISGKSSGASAPPVLLDQKGCEYVPSILAVQTGQKVTVKNSDPVLHNVHATPTEASGNKEMNMAQMPNGPELNMTFSKPEVFLRVKCDVHPWMFAWISVFDHPYFAVSTKDGSFKIPNVPAGKYKLVAAHRKAGTVSKDVEVKEGEPLKTDFELEAK